MVRVLIERRIREGAGQEYERTQRELRFEALRDHGYLTGETWRDVDEPRHYVVISTWRSRREWDAWAVSETRRRVLARMAPLVESERIDIFEHV